MHHDHIFVICQAREKYNPYPIIILVLFLYSARLLTESTSYWHFCHYCLCDAVLRGVSVHFVRKHKVVCRGCLIFLQLRSRSSIIKVHCKENILQKHLTGKVNLPVRQREGALGRIPLCTKRCAI